MEYQTLLGFSGINRGTSHFLLETGEFAEDQNYYAPKIGLLKKTGDYEIKNAQITASQDILGGVDFTRKAGTHEHFVACDGAANADIYKDSGSAWTAQSQSLTVAAKVKFAYSPTLDTLFAVNYEDATRSYNGASWSTSTNVTDAPKAKVPIDFANRMNLLNVDVSGTAYADRMYRSTTVDAGSITWESDEWVTFEDTIIGAGKHMENLFVVCENSAQIWTEEEERYTISLTGGVSAEGIASYSKWAFWAARDGIYAWNGSYDQKISLAIQDYWDAIPEANLSKIQIKILGHHLYAYIGDITVEGRSLANVLFDYNILQNNYNRISLADECKHLHTFVTSSGKKLFMGNDDGEVFQMFSGEAQNTAQFSSFLETGWFYGSGARVMDDFRELWGIGDKLSGLKVSYKVDDDEWKSIRGELNGVSSVVKYRAKGYRIKFLLEETSKGNMYEITRLDVGFLPGYQRKQGEK